MTTRAKRDPYQYVVGVLVLLLGVFTVVQSMHYQHDRTAQQQCFQDKFSELSHSLGVRARLSERESKATRNVLLIYAKAAGALKDNPSGHLSPKDQKELQVEFVHVLLKYKSELDSVTAERKQNPVPPYPKGICD